MLYDKTKQSRGIMDRVGVWNKAKRTKKEEKKCKRHRWILGKSKAILSSELIMCFKDVLSRETDFIQAYNVLFKDAVCLS